MKIVPHSRQEWLNVVLTPFKAYAVIAPGLLIVSAMFPHPRHTGATEAEALLVVLFFPCGALLLLAALLFALIGPKGSALPCAVFGVLELILAWHFLPMLASA